MNLIEIIATDLDSIEGRFIYLPKEKRFFYVSEAEVIRGRVHFYFYMDDAEDEQVVSVSAKAMVLVVEMDSQNS
jgi:hypothetical protein